MISGRAGGSSRTAMPTSGTVTAPERHRACDANDRACPVQGAASLIALSKLQFPRTGSVDASGAAPSFILSH